LGDLKYIVNPANSPAMKHLMPSIDKIRPLPFYLAMEEWAALHLPPDDYLFTWIVDPTVIFGRNQRIDREVNLDYCKEHGIATYRRKSGGGCVYADRGNIMFSHITGEGEINGVFGRYTSMIAGMLRSLGLNASATGRNDILIDGRKVSGNAFYRMPGRSIAHGTMLYDVDIPTMMKAITPSQSKLEYHAVASVESRVTALNRHIGISIDDFRNYAIDRLTDGEVKITEAQEREIEELMQPYLSTEWIMGQRLAGDIRREVNVPGVGEFRVDTLMARGKIARVNLTGDFFLTGDLDRGLLKKIEGASPDIADIERRIEGVDVSSIIPGLTKKQFLNLILPQPVICKTT